LSVIPTDIKEDKTGWFVNYVKTDMDAGEVKEFDKKEGKYFNYIKSLETCKTIGGPIGGPSDPTSDDQDYILTVTIDPDCSSENDPVVEGLLSLEFLGTYYSGAPAAYTWTNPDGSGEEVAIRERDPLGGHSCDRGTYKVVANEHVNGGLVIGRLYMGNTNGIVGLSGEPIYDTYTTAGNLATSPTGDVESRLVDSANAQGNIDSLGNVRSKIYWSTDTDNWGVDGTNSKQRYITTAITNSSLNRYSLVKILPADADEIAANYQDPINPNYVTFTLKKDTYNSNGTDVTHSQALWFQVFKLGATTTEIFADNWTGTAGSSVTFDVTTGEQIP